MLKLELACAAYFLMIEDNRFEDCARFNLKLIDCEFGLSRKAESNYWEPSRFRPTSFGKKHFFLLNPEKLLRGLFYYWWLLFKDKNFKELLYHTGLHTGLMHDLSLKYNVSSSDIRFLVNQGLSFVNKNLQVAGDQFLIGDNRYSYRRNYM